MTYRLPILAAALLFSASAALAAPRVSSTDQARALTGRSASATAAPVAAPSGLPTSTDQARAQVAAAASATAPQSGQHDAVACHRSCGCTHG